MVNDSWHAAKTETVHPLESLADSEPAADDDFLEEQLGPSSLLDAPICQQGWTFGRMKELGGGSNGGASRLVIIVGRPNVPT